MKTLVALVSLLLAGVFVAGCPDPCSQFDDIYFQGAQEACENFPDCCFCACADDKKIDDYTSASDECLCVELRPEGCTQSEQELAEFLLDHMSDSEIKQSGADDVFLFCN